MSNQMTIKSCSECTDKCCSRGPGPYKKVRVEKWLSDGAENLMCKNFNEKTELCTIWNTDKFPVICETFICANKEWTVGQIISRHQILWSELRHNLYGTV